MSVTTNDKMTGIVGTTFAKNATTGFFEATVNGEKALALPADNNGNAKANFSQRQDTLANLLTLAGLPGEISRPTDYRGVVCHTGVAGEAYYVGNEAYVIDVTNGAMISAAGTVTVPLGFTSIVLGPMRATPHANITSNGGLGINYSPDRVGQSPAKLMVTANFATTLVIGFGDALLDLSTGNNYFEVSGRYDIGSGTILTQVITAKTVSYS